MNKHEEEKAMRELARKVMSGVDEWVEVAIDKHDVLTSTGFIKDYSEHLEGWVREFIAQSHKTVEIGPDVGLKEVRNAWQKEFEGQTIFQMATKDPQSRVMIIINTRKRLLDKGFLKQAVYDGQNQTSINL